MRCDYACGAGDHVLSRRRFLGGTCAVLGAVSTGGLTGLLRTSAASELVRSQRQMLVIWMAGGLSQLESWDPKPRTETGGPFRDIETAVPGICISELLPKTAVQMPKLTIVRGVNT